MGFVAYSVLSIEFLVGLVPCKFAYLVLEHCKLLEQVVYRLVAILVHGGLAVERHELLYTAFACSLRKVAEKYQVKHQRRGKYRVAA